MTWATTLTAGTTSASGGPFPPDYAVGAVGFTAAASNPTGDSAGTLTVTTYLGATIAALAYDAASPNEGYFMVALEGSYDQEFLGDVTFTDGGGAQTYAAASANWIQQAVGAQELTIWIWVATGYFVSGDSYTVDIANTGDTPIVLSGAAPSSTEIQIAWNDSLLQAIKYQLWGAVNSSTLSLIQDDIAPGSMSMDLNQTGLAASTLYTYQIVAVVDSAGDQTYGSDIIQVWTPASGVSATFNCDCEAIPAIPTNQTLGALRARLAARLGYAAQATNLPPGAKVLFNEFLTSAQNQVYRFFLDKRISRYWAWQMEIDQRYYNFNQNESGCRSVDSLKIEWVGFEDLNLAWYPLINGIDPVMYTRAQISTGWPTHYEIRSCIEIFPAPKQQYTLWIKGGIQLDPFVADTDYATMDSELVLMLAIGLGKTHYGQPDASSCMTQAANYMSKIVAGLHGTRRYVPRTKTNTLLTPPLFLPTIEPGSSS